MERVRIQTTSAPAAIGPYSQAIRVGQFLFTSGQIPLHPETAEIIGTTVTEQTHRVMQNLEAVLRAGGTSLDQVVKTTCFLASMDDFAEMNAVYGSYFSDVPPARSTVAVRTLPKNVLVEIECVALIAE